MRCGCDAWLMLVQPTSHMVTMEADTCAGAGEGYVINPGAYRWKNLVAEFVDVFEPSRLLAERKNCAQNLVGTWCYASV